MARLCAVRLVQLSLLLAISLVVGACATIMPETEFAPPRLAEITRSQSRLLGLPGPKQPLVVAVYGFEDKTGQHKPAENLAQYSKAVTQGGDAILIKALTDVGQYRNEPWFQVVERSGLDNLLRERQIIRAMRDEYASKEGDRLPPVGALLLAGILLEGGIIGYDSNTRTGGFGARYLGIGGDEKYQEDTVTVYLRAVSVQSGRVLQNVSTTKTIYSQAVKGGAFKFVATDKLLEI